MNKPPKTSQIADEVNAENTTWGFAIANTIASRKNSMAVTCSGMDPRAHRPIVNKINAAACIAVGVAPDGGGQKKTATAIIRTTTVATSDQRCFNTTNIS